jgi:hypothetical protein
MTAIAPGAPRKSRLPRHEGEWRGREESPGAPVPAFRLDVPAPTPDSSPTPLAHGKIIQRCDAPEDECGVFCIFDATGYIPDVPGECPLCRSTGIKYIFEQDFLAEPDRSKHVWFTWEQLGGDSPAWVIGNLDLDWADADPSWSYQQQEQPEQQEQQEQPEQPEEEYEEEPLDDQEEVDEQELHNDLYDGDGEHHEDFLE